jgi:hypothetical protein
MGVDPTASSVTGTRSTVELQPHYLSSPHVLYVLILSNFEQNVVVPVNGIEPLFKAYESFVLPLNYTGK